MMPRFGICGPLRIGRAAKAAGWDYLEASVQAVLQGDADNDAWPGPSLLNEAELPVEAANLLLPPDLKIVGPAIDEERIARYLARIFLRARACGIDALVLGSGVARNIPDGFDRPTALQQLISFTTHAARSAGGSGVALVIEPLNRAECNLINSVREACELVRSVDHPNVRCLVDSYHFWREKEPLSDLAAATPAIRHVHVADEHGRSAPGAAAIASDYRAFFSTLKRGGYDGRISVEAKIEPHEYERTLAFLKHEWAAA